MSPYSPGGRKLGTYQINVLNTSNTGLSLSTVSTLKTSDQYFGSRRLAVLDQLGSAGTYFPWGEAKGSTNPQDTWSFATYWRDSASGFDYANKRYFSNAYGRFMTPDPYQASGGPSDPGSWNRYTYTRADPVNRRDPLGLADCTTCDDGPDNGYCPASIESCAPLGDSGGGGDPNERWYQQVARETAALDPLIGQAFSSWDFVNGNVYQIQIALSGIVLDVPYSALSSIAKPQPAGYWAYFACFFTGVLGQEIQTPEVTGVSVLEMFTGLVTGAAWGPSVIAIGGVTMTTGLWNVEDKVAKDCAKATGYTPWILQN